jgi:L-lactate utilization protein LutB
VTAPSLRERRDKRREAKQARLRDLDKQIAQAEAELNATGHADWSRE